VRRESRRLGSRTCRAGVVAERRRALFDVPLRKTTERVAQPSRCEAYVRSSHSAEQAGLTIQHPSHRGHTGWARRSSAKVHPYYSSAARPHCTDAAAGRFLLRQPRPISLQRSGEHARNDTHDSSATLNRSTDLSRAVMQNDAERRGS
jgi:hypothetical protein